MSDNIKVLKLTNGMNIISKIEMSDDNHLLLIFPMIFDVQYENDYTENSLIIKPWLPYGLVKENKIVLSRERIIDELDPAAVFEEYYTNRANELEDKQVSKPKLTPEEEEAIAILEAMEELPFNTLH